MMPEQIPPLKLWELDAEPLVEREDRPWDPTAVTTNTPKSSEPLSTPPTSEKILEAILFLGGPPLTLDKARQAIRGLTVDDFRNSIDAMTRRYRIQNRPYQIQSTESGYYLEVKPAFRYLAHRDSGAKEIQLNQTAIDVLSIVAYEQPIAPERIDAMYGGACGSAIKQLVKLGFIAKQSDAESWKYVTTPQFLERFELASLADLPKFSSGM